MEKLWVVDVGSIGGTHWRGDVVSPEEFPGPGQWERLIEIGAVRLETADEAEARLVGSAFTSEADEEAGKTTASE